MFPDKAGSILYRKMVLGTRIRTCFRGMVSKKTYREKTKLNRNIECKGAYSVADLFLWMKLDGGVSIMKRTIKLRLLETGYVGLAIATLLSQHHQVTAVDIIPEKVDMINNGSPRFRMTILKMYLAENESGSDCNFGCKGCIFGCGFCCNSRPDQCLLNKQTQRSIVKKGPIFTLNIPKIRCKTP